MAAEFNYRDFTAIAYDFDGTLKDSVPDHQKARELAFAAMAEATDDERFVTIEQAIHDEAHSHGSHPSAIIGWVLSRAGIVTSDEPALDPITIELVKRKKEFYFDLAADGGKPVKGAVEFVRRMSTYRPDKEYIVTTAERQTEVSPYLVRHELTGYFPDKRIIAQEDSGPDHLKPDPWAYEEMLKRAGLVDRPNRVLAIEDSPSGIAAARQAGLIVGAITTTHTFEQLGALTGMHEPHFIVASFEELATRLFG